MEPTRGRPPRAGSAGPWQNCDEPQDWGAQQRGLPVLIQLLSRVRLLGPRGLQPARLLHPWDSPGKSTGLGCHFLHQGTFLTQGWNLRLLHCRQILYSLSQQGSPKERRRYEHRTVRSSSPKGSKSRKRVSMQSKLSEVRTADFPGGLVVETPCFQGRGHGFDPRGQGTEIPGLLCGAANTEPAPRVRNAPQRSG